jgi:2-iminobutanoate/2-iminopropanoate deaminase
MIERLTIPGAPTPRGPYSPAVRAGDCVYVSGQVGLDTATGQLVPGGIQAETRQVLSNIQKILEGCGSSLAQVVRCGVYLTEVSDFKPMNQVYAEFFGEAKPARTTIVVASLPMPEAKIEVDVIAYLG